MSHDSIINTASGYFELLEGAIITAYSENPLGFVDPAVIKNYFNSLDYTLTQGALKAHLWTLEQLNYAIERFFRGRPWNAVQRSQEIYDFYNGLNYEEYLKAINADHIRNGLNRWLERKNFYELKGDLHSQIFCERKCELFALALSRGMSVKDLQTPAVEKYLDYTVGVYDPASIDHNLIRHQ